MEIWMAEENVHFVRDMHNQSLEMQMQDQQKLEQLARRLEHHATEQTKRLEQQHIKTRGGMQHLEEQVAQQYVKLMAHEEEQDKHVKHLDKHHASTHRLLDRLLQQQQQQSSQQMASQQEWSRKHISRLESQHKTTQQMLQEGHGDIKR